MNMGVGECKDVMSSYLSCIKKTKGMNDPECRNLAKGYLTCRMDRLVSFLHTSLAGRMFFLGEG
jgi:hypothetical protein